MRISRAPSPPARRLRTCRNRHTGHRTASSARFGCRGVCEGPPTLPHHSRLGFLRYPCLSANRVPRHRCPGPAGAGDRSHDRGSPAGAAGSAGSVRPAARQAGNCRRTACPPAASPLNCAKLPFNADRTGASGASAERSCIVPGYLVASSCSLFFAQPADAASFVASRHTAAASGLTRSSAS